MRLAAVRRARPGDRASKVAIVVAAALALAVALPAASSARRQADVLLGLWPAGTGLIEATVEGTGTVLEPCDSESDEVKQAGSICFRSVPDGARVRITAKQTAGDSPFLHWNRFDCEGTGACVVEASDGDVVVGTFRKQQLEIIMTGAGTVKSTSPPFSCDDSCIVPVAADTELVLEADQPHTWGRGCEPAGGDPRARTCSLTMTNGRTFALIGFGEDPDTLLPFDVRVKLRVQRSGPGSGTVTGQGRNADDQEWRIDCGATCAAEQIQIQSRVTLTAQESDGSRFVRWLGVCSTDRVCRFAAGTKAFVGAVFEPVTQTPPPPPSPPPPAFEPKVTKVAVVRTGGARAVVLRVLVDRRASATLRLVRGQRTLRTRRFALATGRNELRFPLPRVAAGWYALRGTFVSAQGQSVAFRRPLALRR